MYGIVADERIRERIMTLLRAAAHSLREREVCRHLIEKLQGAHFLRYGYFAPIYLVGKPMGKWDRTHLTVLGRAIHNLECSLYAHLEKSHKEERAWA